MFPLIHYAHGCWLWICLRRVSDTTIRLKSDFQTLWTIFWLNDVFVLSIGKNQVLGTYEGGRDLNLVTSTCLQCEQRKKAVCDSNEFFLQIVINVGRHGRLINDTWGIIWGWGSSLQLVASPVPTLPLSP